MVRNPALEADARKRSAETRRRNSRNQILGAAALIMNGRGYYFASIADISEESGRGQATIYNLFERKSKLALRLLDTTFMALHKQDLELTDGAAAADVPGMLRRFAQSIEQYPGIALAFTQELEKAGLQTVYDSLHETRDAMLGGVVNRQESGQIRRDLSAENVRDLILDEALAANSAYVSPTPGYSSLEELATAMILPIISASAASR